ncbi:MAG: DNA primase [Alphaproteobacteria bacterium]|jgi:DNA primase|nr:DNA primase [Alphaproteobacteria bacterium]
MELEVSFVPPEFLEELKSRLNISDIVSSRIQLKKHGNTYKACCPFHNEKTPSFVVDNKRGNYHCFGCGAHGDIFSFVMQYDGVDFPSAIENLARQAGISIPKTQPTNPERYKQRTGLFELMEQACQYYQRALMSSDGVSAQGYIMKRGITKQAVSDFRLGYAPHGNNLIGFLESKNFTKKQMIEAGLVRENNGRAYCFFRNRLMFPVIDKRGRVVAFSARILDGDGPKYINSSETPIYNKGSLLYGANLIRKEKEIFVVEGNVDVVSMNIAGFKGTVAPLGTALTENQISEIWKMSNNPVLCFDGDSAGYKAGERAIHRALPILKPDYSLNLVFMPTGEDPDTLIKTKGVSHMRDVLSKSKSLFDCLWDFEVEKANMNTPEGKAGFEKSIKEKIFEIKDEAVRGYYLSAVKDKLFQSRNFKNSGKYKKAGLAPKPKGVKLQRDLNLKAIMASILNYPEIFDDIANDLLNIDNLSKSKLYEKTYLKLEDESVSSEDLISYLREEGFSDSLNKVLNNEVYLYFQWCRPNLNKDELLKNVKFIIEEIVKQQIVRKEKMLLKDEGLSDDELHKLLLIKKEKLKKK